MDKAFRGSFSSIRLKESLGSGSDQYEVDADQSLGDILLMVPHLPLNQSFILLLWKEKKYLQHRK